MGDPGVQHGHNIVFLLATDTHLKHDEGYQTICPGSVSPDCTYFDMH